MPDQHDTPLSVNDPLIHHLTWGDIIRLTLTSQACLLSFISFLFVLLVTIRNAIHRRRRRRQRRPTAPMRTQGIFQKPMYTLLVLLLCIISADILQTIGSALDLEWIRGGYLAEVAEVPFAQGALKQISIVLSSLLNNGTFLP